MSFQVVVDATQQNMVLGVGPFDEGTDFGAEFPIYVIEDDAEYESACVYNPPYLCVDQQTIKPEPC